MKKITSALNSPARIALFAVCIVLIIGTAAFATIRAGAGINPNKTLGMDKGVNIALDDAGLHSEDVSNLSAHYDTEDGIPVYEVTFTAGGFEYEYQIKASDGTILEADRDVLKQNEPAKKPVTDTAKTSAGTTQTTPTSNYIGVDKAKSIALNHAGLSASSVTFTKAKLDREDGIRVYEVEFYTSTKEYEYEINAKSGKITNLDVDAFEKKYDDDHDDDDHDDDNHDDDDHDDHDWDD